jgi:DNA-binding PadR family transcriptional regulator
MEGADFLKLEELILLAIAGKSEIYGLEIATEIAKASEDKVQLNYGSLYPYLNRLEKKGYISSRWEEENERKGARRKYYQITDKGTQSLDEATLIRQRLRQPSYASIQSDSQINRKIETLLPILLHPEETERIQAIYQLENAATNDPEHHWEVMQALATFIRTNSPRDRKGKIVPEIQAALEVIGNRKIDRDNPFESIDLSKTNLIEANLRGANLRGANLRGANLAGAILVGADLRGSNLINANLKGTILIRANLIEANLLEANLLGAYCGGAYIGRTNIRGADIEGADLTRVEDLTIDQLHSARNWEQALNTPADFK